MNCKKCGAPLTEHDQFCKNCGAPVENLSAQNNNMVNVGQAPSFTQNQFNQVQQPVNNMQPNPIPVTPVNNGQNPAVGGLNIPTMQQPINYQNNYTPVSSSAKKGNKSLFVIIGIVAAVIVIAIIFLLGCNSDGNSKSTYTVNHNGFTYKIPTNLIYSTDGDYLTLANEEDTWAALLGTVEGNYNQIVSNKNQVLTNLQSNGYTINNLTEKTIGGVKFLTGEASLSGNNVLIAYAKANSMYVFGVIASTINNDFDYDVLKNISSILKSAEMTNRTNNISTFDKTDLGRILLAQ